MARNDTTTPLSAPTGSGDIMDESVVTQTDGTTEAKRPRVVLGDDSGKLFDAATGDSTQDAIPVSLPGLAEIDDKLGRIENLLILILDKL